MGAPTWKAVRCLQNTTEDEAHGEHQRHDGRCGLRVRERGDDHLAQSGRKDEELDDEEEHEALTFRGLDAYHRVVEAAECQDTGDDLLFLVSEVQVGQPSSPDTDLVGNFHNHVSNEERSPAV